jgi:outer membrane protein assembly factor BamB
MLMRVMGFAAVFLATGILAADEFVERRLENWHQWRGPEATGVAPKGDPPTEWSETKNIKWKVEIPGQGSASPIIWGDRIFVMTAIKTDQTAGAAETAAAASTDVPFRQVALVETSQPQTASASLRKQITLLAQNNEDQRSAGPEGRRGGRDRGRGPAGADRPGGSNRFGIVAPKNVYQFVVLCLDRKTGDTLWQRTAAELVPHEGHHPTASFASASPVTDGKRVWAWFGSQGMYCYDLDGKPLWDKDLGDMQTRFMFGEGSSPALYGDTLVLIWDHEGDDFIIALDASTGNEKWRKPREEQTSWSTPLVVEAAGRRQVITSASNRIRSYDLDSGELLWECGGLGSNAIASPVEFEGLAIAMTGHNDPAGIAVPLDAKGDVTDSDKIAWQLKDGGTPYIASPILYEDLLYFTKGRNAILSSVEAKTGNVIINQKRLPDEDTVYASPVGAAGRIYFSSREGTTVVIKHARDFEVLATNHLDETIDASPAIVGKEMFIRGEKHLYCVAE